MQNMNNYVKQVEKEQYNDTYESFERWISFITQIQEVTRLATQAQNASILEVGVGSGTTCSVLRAKGFEVLTADIDPELAPDYVASITSLPLPDNSVDVVLCAEVLEHIKFEDVGKALIELFRISRHGVVISVPNVFPYVSGSIKIPLCATWQHVLTLPIPLKKDRFDGEHYWEIGRRHYPKKRFTDLLTTNKFDFTLTSNYRLPGCPFHHFFVLEKKV
jgi:ubiquinone/menaquinone biosynthesis C-methylase UbiE